MHDYGCPRALESDVFTEVVEGDLLVYNEATNTAHRLNRTASLVWSNCDGKRDVAELVEVLREELGEIADEDLVLVTLDDLTANGLLEGTQERARDLARLSRRRFIRRVGLVGTAALALPVVHSVVAPEPAAAQTGGTCTCDTCSCFSCYCACYCVCTCA